jgi:hypothetical protein
MCNTICGEIMGEEYVEICIKELRLKRSDKLKILKIKLENTTSMVKRAKGDPEHTNKP